MVEKLKKYRCTYISDQGNKFDADADESDDGEFFKVEDVEAILNSAQQRYAKIAAELEQCAVDMNSDKLIPIVTCLNQWARLLRQ